MSKNIVICSDGTGNRGGKTRGTNVWRIFNAVDRHGNETRQITYYDDGVGTGSPRWWRLFTGAFGYGLARNIREAYAFLAINYEPGDNIFLFGFSRGAFTVRALAGLICRYGIATRDAVTGPRREREAVLRCILQAYRSRDGSRRQRARQTAAMQLGAKWSCFRAGEVQFIGVWDTVDAVGMPFDELKRTLSWLWSFTDNLLWEFRDYEVPRCVRHAYQALALDDERKTFHPVFWGTPSGRKGASAGEGEKPNGFEPGRGCEPSDKQKEKRKRKRKEAGAGGGAGAEDRAGMVRRGARECRRWVSKGLLGLRVPRLDDGKSSCVRLAVYRWCPGGSPTDRRRARTAVRLTCGVGCVLSARASRSVRAGLLSQGSRERTRADRSRHRLLCAQGDHSGELRRCVDGRAEPVCTARKRRG